MTGAIAPLTDFSGWARGDLLVIVLLVLGAILLTRLAIWVRGRVIAQIDAHAIESDELVRSEAAKHRQVVAQVVTWAVLAVIYVVTAVLVVQRLGVPLAGLVAPAALLSAALGFGLQRFVQDIAAGFFITGERQYGFGNVVRIEVTGVSSRPLARSRTSPSGSPASGRSVVRSSRRPTARSSRSLTCRVTGRGSSWTFLSRPLSTSAMSPTSSGGSARMPTVTTGCAS